MPRSTRATPALAVRLAAPVRARIIASRLPARSSACASPTPGISRPNSSLSRRERSWSPPISSAEHLRDVGDDAVAGAAPERVVDPLQVVEVDDHHRAALAGQAARADLAVDGRLEGATVHQAGQLVVLGEVAEPVLGRLLLADVGDQALDDHHAVRRWPCRPRPGRGPRSSCRRACGSGRRCRAATPSMAQRVLGLEHPLEVVGVERALPEVGVGHRLVDRVAGDLLDLRGDEVPLAARSRAPAR